MKWFSSRLFKESARTTRILNIFYIIVAIIAGISGPVYRIYLKKMGYDFEGTLLRPDYFTSLLLWVVIIFNVAQIMRLFSYHFSRKGSDFYHALPFTRQCFVITNMTLIVLRDILAIGLALAIKVVVLKISGTTVFPMSFPILAFVYLMIISFMILAAMLAAISLSGTLVFAIILGFMILLLPRFVYFITILFVGDMSGVTAGGFIPYFSDKYNLLFHSMINWAAGQANVYEGYNIPGIIVSLSIAVIMGIAAMVLFINRKSEYAENAVPGSKTDFVMHLMVTLVAALPMIGFAITTNETDVVIALCVVSIIFFVIYGLYRRKGVKGFVRTLPRLIVVAVICLIYAGFIAGVSYSVKNKEIKAEDVKAVQIFYHDDGNMYVDDVNVYESYASVAHHDVEYTDEEIIKLCVKGYNRRVDDMSNGNNRYNYYVTTYTVKFIMEDGKEYIRKISLSDSMSIKHGDSNAVNEVSRLNELVSKDKERIKFDSSLPEAELYSTIFESDERNKRIVEIYKNEFMELSTEDRIALAGESYYFGDGYFYSEEYSDETGDNVSISFETYYNKTVPTRYYITLSKKIMPKTYKYYVESIIAEKKEALENVSSFANTDENGHAMISFTLFEDSERHEYSVVFDRQGDFRQAYLYYDKTKTVVATEGDADSEEEESEGLVYFIDGEKAEEALRMFVKTYKIAEQEGTIDSFIDAEFYSSDSMKEKSAYGIPVEIDESAVESAVDYFLKNGRDETENEYY